MAAISSMFRRLGFVKLDEYGLLLTPEGRVLSTRSAILDDGLGGKIVGWREGDLAAMELERWQSPAVAKPHGPPMTQRVAAPIVPIPAPTPAPPVATIVAAPAPIQPVAVAVEEPVVEEDEWEWEIAMARARAAAEWAEEAAAAAPSIVRTPPPLPVRPAPIVVAAPAPAPIIEEFPKTEELHTWDTPSTPITIERIVRPVLAIGSAPNKTVIPVPSLPRVTDPKLLRPYATTRPPVAPKRYPRATGRVDDDTVRTQSAPANDVRLPAGASGAKRVAAKQR